MYQAWNKAVRMVEINTAFHSYVARVTEGCLEPGNGKPTEEGDTNSQYEEV